MSIPTQPTETTIIQKAYRLYGKFSPTSTEQTRAEDALAQVKSDMMDEGREWSFLRRQSFLSMTINVNHVQAPTDYSKLISATVLDGTRRDTAQAGASSTITLASTDSGLEGSTEGKLIVITGGTGSGQGRQIEDYNSTTKVATVDEAWTTTPDNTSTYLVVDKQLILNEKEIWRHDHIQHTHVKARPEFIYHRADDAEGDFYFDYTPDKIYVIQLKYYSDLRKEDTDTSANPRYARILRLVEQLFVQGVFAWLLQDDKRFNAELTKYASMLSRASGQFLYPNQANQSAMLAEDVY